MEDRPLKSQISHFGRAFALLLNRTLMYQASHPFIKQSISEALTVATPLLEKITPLVFILNRGQFFIDEEPLDPRMNVTRIANLFKKNNLQSISFEIGLMESELSIFTELFTTMPQGTTAEILRDGLIKKGVFNIKINHVTFKKVTEDDQIVSRDALKDVTPMMDADDDENRKKFMETVLESVLSEEFAKTLNISNLMSSPKDFTRKMIEADLATGFNVEEGQTDEGLGTGAGEGPSGQDDGTGSGLGTGGGIGAGPGQGQSSGPGDGQGSYPGAFESTGQGLAGGRGTGSGAYTKTGTLIIEPASGKTHPDKGAAGLAGGGGAIQSASDTAGAAGRAGRGVSPGSAGGPGHGAGMAGQQGTGAAGDGAGTPGQGTGAESQGIPGKGSGPGPLLLHQLELMHVEVEKHLQGDSDVGIAELAQAIFDMKKQLLEGIQAQKALGVAYANESAILEAANKLTDQVMVELIREEYQAGNISTQRLAYIIRRLIPEATELKRLLPMIKKTLLAEGMPASEYLNLIHELRNELENEELTRVLQESAESIGIDGDELIEEVKKDPTQAAELIYLASEIRKSGGDDAALSDILIEYVDRIGNQLASEMDDEDGQDGEDHLKNVMETVESSILKKLGSMNVNADLIQRMEERINQRMESIMDKMRAQWLNTQANLKRRDKPQLLSVLQTLEHNVSEDEELSNILKIVREKVDAGEIEENNFSQINQEINRQREASRSRMEETPMPEGVLTSEDLMFILEKEIARTRRYGAPFSVLALAFVSAKPKTKSEEGNITNEIVLHSAMDILSKTFREVDYIGQIGKNKILSLLPMASETNAKQALSRVLKALHGKPLVVNGTEVQLRVAGITATYESDSKLDVKTFTKNISTNLADMVSRVKSIQVLF